jgi:MYXO-CTERM domain-containing protein
MRPFTIVLRALAMLALLSSIASPARATLYEYTFWHLTNPLAGLSPIEPDFVNYSGNFAADDRNGDGIVTRDELIYFFLGPVHAENDHRLWPPTPFDSSGPSCDPCTSYTYLNQFQWNMHTGEFVADGGQDEQFYFLRIITGDRIYDPGGACMMCGPSTYYWTPQSYTTVREVPEPTSATLALLGLAALGTRRRVSRR